MKITLGIDYPEHDLVVLTNERGDTYTSKSEELMDFLHGLGKDSSENKMPRTILGLAGEMFKGSKPMDGEERRLLSEAIRRSSSDKPTRFRQ